MSTTYEQVAFTPPDLELLVASHLRSLNTRPGTLFDRRFPDALPVTITGTNYTAAVIIRDDGGTWPNRSLSVIVQGARDADYAATRSLAITIASRVSVLADQSLPVAAVMAVRGPLSVADNPPEFHITADLVLVG